MTLTQLNYKYIDESIGRDFILDMIDSDYLGFEMSKIKFNVF